MVLSLNIIIVTKALHLVDDVFSSPTKLFHNFTFIFSILRWFAKDNSNIVFSRLSFWEIVPVKGLSVSSKSFSNGISGIILRNEDDLIII